MADPRDTNAIVQVLLEFFSFLDKQKSELRTTWGRPEVRREYEAPVVAAKFQEIILGLCGR